MDRDDVIARAFIERLDKRELNGHFNVELSKLSYAELLRVSQILAERAEKDSEK